MITLGQGRVGGRPRPGGLVRESGDNGHLPEGRKSPWLLPHILDLGENCGLTSGCLGSHQASSWVCGPCLQHPVCVKPPLSVACAIISKPRQTQSDSCSPGTYPVSPPSTVTTTNVSRHCQLSPEGGSKTASGLVASAWDSTDLTGERSNAMSNCDMPGQVLGWGTCGQCDIRRNSSPRRVQAGNSEE